MKKYEAIVIGGGCAGLAAAIALKENGIHDIVLLEKDVELGGILNQCIHNGFGLMTFHEQLSGPSYAQKYIDQAKAQHIEMKTSTTVISITKDKTVSYENAQEGIVTICADVILLTVGCYERNRGAVQIDGTRCAGIFTAGQAQRYVNIEGYMPGKRVFILGSGDIGLIMARRMHLEGAEVLGVAEIMPYSNGLPRNIKQCLEDFHIPLYLSHTVTKVYGKDRLEAIDVCKVDENRIPITSEVMHISCDTLLLSIGLIPENHLAEQIGILIDQKTKGPIVDENFMTSIPGIFAAGNGLHVHDLADYAARQGQKAAMGAIRYLHDQTEVPYISTRAGNLISYVLPQILHIKNLPKVVDMYFRVQQPIENGDIVIRSGNHIIHRFHKEHLLPSEMEIVTIASQQILQEELTVEVEHE